ncbi:MAG: hypothetical protein K2I46_01620, partial [Clostridia bacterium]|nr:hypothetical protein [Clostridia bacterium]
MELNVYQEDVLPYVYFVSSMAQQSQSGMFGALSSKSDMIGGIFDRWINIIPESITFNKYYLIKAKECANVDKSVVVFSDFFMYNPKKVGIAPDLIGIKIDDNIVPFVKYDDTNDNGYWVAQANCPQIEVKSFFGKNKYMVSLRDQNYQNKYLVMVTADISVDYLLSFFNGALFSDDTIHKLDMPDDFIVSNTKNLLSQTKSVSFGDCELGVINILVTTTANDFMSCANKLNKGDIPRFFKNVETRNTNIQEHKYQINESLSNYCQIQPSGLYRFNERWKELFSNPKELTLDIRIDDPSNLKIIKKN